MILSKNVNVTINSANFKYLKNKGYIFKNKNEIIQVKIEDLSKGSHSEVEIKCDYCDCTRLLAYKSYLNSIKNQNIYACSACRSRKIKNTVKEKYGVENVFQLDDVKEKSKSTCLDKYGVDYYKKTTESKERYIKYCQENFGKDNLFQVDFFKEKSKKSNLNKYGVETPMMLSYIKDKLEKTFVEKYGVVHPMKLDSIIHKTNQTKIKNGNRSAYLNEFKIYRNKVSNETKKYKKQLFDNWDGYDFYDNHFIKDNLTLHYNNKLYPTIDHKISVFFGFENNIPVEIISNINNLCITKRYINSKKGNKNNDTFTTS